MQACVSDMFPTQHNADPGGEADGRAAAPAQHQCGQVQLESGEGWLSGEPRSRSAPTKRQTVSPGCQHLLQRLYHLPEARGWPHLPQSLTSCRVPDVDLNSHGGAENPVRAALSCVSPVGRLTVFLLMLTHASLLSCRERSV